MVQTVIVILILAVTALLAVRWLVRTLRGKGGCGCGCKDCPHGSGHCDGCSTRLPDIEL